MLTSFCIFSLESFLCLICLDVRTAVCAKPQSNFVITSLWKSGKGLELYNSAAEAKYRDYFPANINPQIETFWKNC